MKITTCPITRTGLGLLITASLSGPVLAERSNEQAANFGSEAIIHRVFDGVTDDLLTAGLGASGLASGVAPGYADPAHPTAMELRRNAIHGNYRALVDTSAGGGYKTLFGPNVTADGMVTEGEGLIGGDEYLTYAGGRRNRVVLMVQVPASFNPDAACIITAPSSGSRGIYGAIGTAGEWGLKRGCAVAYTDKGTGTGAHNLQADTVNLLDGVRTGTDLAGRDAHFSAGLRDRKRERFNAATPDRFAFKHAHSQSNPEQNWGDSVLQSIEFAFDVLNQQYGETQRKGRHRDTIRPDNTLVIASSVSNGGGASLRAAEADRQGLIDAVAVSEPNVNPQFSDEFGIRQGSGPLLRAHSRSLFDYTTLLNVYQGCASLPDAIDAPFNFAASEARCEALAAKGLLSAGTPAEQAVEAQSIINDYGFLPDQNRLQPSHWFLNVPQSIAVTYANAYARASVTENLCGYSFAATNANGQVMSIDPATEAVMFATSNGIPPSGGLGLVSNNASNGPIVDRQSISVSSGLADQNLDGALCLRALATGRDAVSGARLQGRMAKWSKRIAQGIRKIRAEGDLDGRPVVIVTGRNDAILPLNHTSRAYVGLNQSIEGAASGVRYYEVTNAHHLDVLNGFAGFKEEYVPLHHYYQRALDLLFAHLQTGTELPPSQVVRTLPRGVDTEGNVPDLTLGHLPELMQFPDAGDAIVFTAGELRIPD
ncbi:MAG: 3-hydroxybutyrate oligomer hydrolase family protein [Motiliproteus sp.]